MASKVRIYVTPNVTSFSESEVMDLLGVATTYGTPDSITNTDPSSGGHSSTAGDPKKAHK